jgi:hypothetical protein
MKGRFGIVAARFDGGCSVFDVRALVLVVLVTANVPVGGIWLVVTMWDSGSRRHTSCCLEC